MKVIDKIHNDIERKKKKGEQYHIGLALGGGLLNGSFGGGVVEAIDDLQLSPNVTVVIGSSAGAIPAVFYATGIDICKFKESFHDRKNRSFVLKKSDIFYPNYKALKNLLRLASPLISAPKNITGLYDNLLKPRSFFSSMLQLPRKTLETTKSLRDFLGYNVIFSLFLKRVPFSGFLSIDRIEKFIERNLEIRDFPTLEEMISTHSPNGSRPYKRLYLTGCLLDYTGRRVVFGKEKKEVPIPVAAAASMSFPLLFRPKYVKELGCYVIDGEISNALSMDVILEDCVDLSIGTNIYIPYNYDAQWGSLTDHGLGYITQQTVLILINQKIKRSLQHYGVIFPDRDIVMIQPNGSDSSNVFFDGYFNYDNMIRAWDLGYKRTMAVFESEVVPVKKRGRFKTLLTEIEVLQD